MKVRLLLCLPGLLIFLSACETSSNWGNIGKKGLSPFRTKIPINIPTLISPVEGAVLDNGRTDGEDKIVWEFYWSNVKGATAYHLYVIHQGSQYPVVDNIIETTYFQFISERSYIACCNRFNWKWKVRIYKDGEYGEWSEERTFSVEPVNTDPPSCD